MTGRQSMPGQGRYFAAAAAIALVVALHAGPAVAASSTPVKCDDIADITLDIAASDLKAHIVSHEIDAKGVENEKSVDESDALSSTHYLAPRVEAVLRKVFKKDTATPVADRPIADSDKQPEMNTRIPGISDDELARHKRQMYRKDI